MGRLRLLMLARRILYWRLPSKQSPIENSRDLISISPRLTTVDLCQTSGFFPYIGDERQYIRG